MKAVVELIPEAGWTAIDPFKAPPGRGPTFVRDDPGGRYQVRYFKRDADGALVGKVWLSRDCQGPPGFAHGGCVAALLDEAMGGAAWIAGYRVVAVRLTLNFRKPVPLETVLSFEASVDRVEGRKIMTVGRLSDTTTSEGLFLLATSLVHSADRDQA